MQAAKPMTEDKELAMALAMSAEASRPSAQEPADDDLAGQSASVEGAAVDKTDVMEDAEPVEAEGSEPTKKVDSSSQSLCLSIPLRQWNTNAIIQLRVCRMVFRNWVAFHHGYFAGDNECYKIIATIISA